jgi:lysophospholipase L1-like esterase
MKNPFYRFFMPLAALGVAALSLGLESRVGAQSRGAGAASFSNFDRRARKGEQLSVVFFGGSLTWGANASDPQETSYRALISQKLRAHYPRAQFRFRDAAIGGTNSQLGAFRLERDVLRYKPDLVFLDFTVNDNPYEIGNAGLAAYEAIVRRLAERNVLVLQVLLAVQKDVEPNPPARPLDARHQAIARAYGCPSADVVAGMRRMVVEGDGSPGQWWLPGDETHPGDRGYAAYAQVVWQTYLDAVRKPAPLRVPPQMLHATTYLSTTRTRLSSLGALPEGWRCDRPNRISAWYDALMSRWMEDVVVAENPKDAPQRPAALRVRFRGSTALLFAEATLKSGKYRVLLDGKPSPFKDGDDMGTFNASATPFGGNMHHVRVVAQGLDLNVEHVLEIQPLLEPGEELRIESLCVAGQGAQVLAAIPENR